MRTTMMIPMTTMAMMIMIDDDDSDFDEDEDVRADYCDADVVFYFLKYFF